MTPKEKARQLFDKYFYCNINEFKFTWMSINGAKDCALIAVDEILDIAYWEFMESGGKQEKEFWRQVKQEIEKI